MNLRPYKVAIVDSGFWMALFTERDAHHAEAKNKADILLHLKYILPWPTLYETLNTRLVRRPEAVRRFAESFLKRPNAQLLDDGPYRERALERTLSEGLTRPRGLSLVDNVIREILGDINVRLNCIVTFNIGDFVDICKRRNVEIL